MKRQRELDLLVDVAKLLKKYGPETFESLAKLISSPETTRHLSSILSQVAEKAPAKRKARKKKGPERHLSIPKSLAVLKSTRPEKYRLLMDLHTDLVAKEVLPSLRDIREFARDFGLPEVRAKSRQKAINPLIGSLVGFPNEQLNAMIQSLDRFGAADRSLEGWSDIILNK